MGYGNAKAIFEHEFNPWLTKSYKNLWFIKGWKVRMFWNWYPSSRSMIGWLMINGCVPQQLAQTVAWFKPCSCLFTKWGSLTAQSGLERSFLKASGTQCSATCQPSTPPRTFLPAFVQRYFQTPVSIQTFGGIIVPSKVSTTCPHDIHAGHGAQKFWCGCATEACCWACRDWYPYAGSKFSGPQKEVDAPFSMPAGNSTVILCLLICYMLMYHFNPWYRVISDLWDLISEKKTTTFRAVPSYWSTKLVSLTSWQKWGSDQHVHKDKNMVHGLVIHPMMGILSLQIPTNSLMTIPQYG